MTTFGFGGFYHLPTQFRSYSAEDGVESVNYTEHNGPMKCMLVRLWTVGPLLSTFTVSDCPVAIVSDRFDKQALH